MADLTHMNLQQLRNFRDHDVEDVLKAIRKCREEDDDSGVPPLGKLVDGKHNTADNLDKEHQALQLGPMVMESDLVNGQTLEKALKKTGGAMAQLLKDQEKFFEELKDGLDETIEKMEKTKQNNMDSIDAQTLLQNFSGLDGTFSSGSEDDD